MGSWGYPVPPAPENSLIRPGASVVTSIGNPPLVAAAVPGVGQDASVKRG